MILIKENFKDFKLSELPYDKGHTALGEYHHIDYQGYFGNFYDPIALHQWRSLDGSWMVTEDNDIHYLEQNRGDNATNAFKNVCSTLVHNQKIYSNFKVSFILVLTAKGFGKMSYAEDREITDEEGNVRHYDGYRQTHRGTKGVLTLKITPKNGKLVALRAVNGDEDLVVITTAGIVMRTPLTEVKIAGRNTQCVKIINLEDRQKVASISIVPHEDPSSEEEEPLEGEEAEPAEEATNEEPVNPNEVI